MGKQAAENSEKIIHVLDDLTEKLHNIASRQSNLENAIYGLSERIKGVEERFSGMQNEFALWEKKYNNRVGGMDSSIEAAIATNEAARQAIIEVYRQYVKILEALEVLGKSVKDFGIKLSGEIEDIRKRKFDEEQ